MVGNVNPTLCADGQCAVCGIAGQSLKLSLSTTRFPGRFGVGLYFSSVSSKSNDYAAPQNSAKPSYRAIFLCSIAVGKGYEVYQDQPQLTAPPQGYDSVLGQTGHTLNYDEVIVYDEAAVLPLYLITYEV